MTAKNKKILSISIYSLNLLILILLFLRAFRPQEYVVLATDSAYELLGEADFTLLKKAHISIKKESEFPKQGFFGKLYLPAGNIFVSDEIPLLPQDHFSYAKDFVIEEKALLPVFQDDFSDQALLPDMGISFCTPESLPEKSRALLVDNLHANEEGYALQKTKILRCTVFIPKIQDKLFQLIEGAIFEKRKLSSKEDTVFIASVGDIMVARGVQEILLKEDGVDKVFGDTLPLIRDSDFSIGNLEGVVTDSWENAIKTYTFKFKKAVLPKLMDAGFDYLMQTNNHCYDYGESGFKDTLKAFKEYDIPSSGIGQNLDEAKKFYHTKVGNLSISVISCGAFPVERSGFDGKKTATATESRAGILWESDELLEDVKKEKDAGNFVIVNVHGGEEYHFVPSKKQREFYEKLCDYGADVVFGSHPHVLQKSEWYNKSLIVYSMGNFIFNGMEDMRGGTDSEVVRVGVVDGNIAYVEHYPVAIGDSSVALKKPRS